MFDTSPKTSLPNAIGVGYKPQHFTDILQNAGPVDWLEVHAENYMGSGGRPLAQLDALAERFPLSIHGVALSIGGERPLDRDHLNRLKTLCDRVNPASFSEHLAWSTHDMGFMNDLLPLPYTQTTLDRVIDHVAQVQDTIGRQMLLENPSNYLAFEETQMPEVEFLTQIAARTGCGLLLDINNVFVSATNQQTDPLSYLDAFPLEHVGEIHLGGHDEDEDDHGAPLLIDSHGREVADPVWALLDHVLLLAGPKPILIEWDTDVPDWATLSAEAERAKTAMAPFVETVLA